MATWIEGPREWTVQRDSEGHRTYRITHLVISDSTLDGPATVLQTPGLPVPGSFWLFDNDIDIYATCRLDAEVRQLVRGEPNRHFEVTQIFSTKPTNRCSDQQVSDPLLEPQKVSGSYIGSTEEGTEDRFGRPIVSSSHEQLRGPQNEWDVDRPAVEIVQNVAQLGIEVFGAMANTLNDSPLWGLPARAIKFRPGPWSRNYHGQCSVYYTRRFNFEVRVKEDEDGNLKGAWDRDILDEGSKVLHGKWNETTGEWELISIDGASPDPSNPQHFDRFTDRNGNPAHAILNGNGLPAGVLVTGVETELLATTSIAESAFTPTAQPPSPARIIMRVTDADVGMTGGMAVFLGTGTNGEEVVDTIFLAEIGTYDYSTTAVFETLTSVTILDLAGSTTYVDFSLHTNELQTEAGKIHVEKYDESNFLVLGIPLVL